MQLHALKKRAVVREGDDAMRNDTVIDLDWEQQREDFAADGSLRDIYVEGATLADWQALLELAVRVDPAAELLANEEPIPFSTPITRCFEGDASCMLRFSVGGIILISHFFTETEIDLDLLPAEVRGERELQSLLIFLAELGALTRKPVTLTPEGLQAYPIFRYDPDDARVHYLPGEGSA
jgi:hypothetical protein